ncbi:2Fe-2S iron-sulfur cluster-binding protein [Serratia rhizosphaerae]|uniref:2Fe-2S iron-sulfur cluster-binding protein n=1 Tax=unclassified Serratia (in: enterobacteria) TaxID=2647522 RepID=UPI000CF73B3B|nr:MULTISPECIES: 2Fe-2S iron-sulfur cluster-binding protein [unclassified Serratia (in: enterobacteria)]MBU3891334.1 (2Fe-2S)-binding protein [Serratia rubidaea]AVJ17170.1 (2Fe-2S)-binding protein [Serratia sp. MYb239]MCA4823688.1 (2Fe-2S)-binding protein [Serratia rubidaea]QNK30909.1 (2Fe-2S)-binding protein [Serratia sp. JUb9]QPT15182.1 (2Fe-2S)-binding protein [Serratia rubidaea]
MSKIAITIDGERFWVRAGISVAAALSMTPQPHCRRSVTGQPRTPFCGMGICQECRVSINGVRRLACQTLCQPEMHITRSDNG